MKLTIMEKIELIPLLIMLITIIGFSVYIVIEDPPTNILICKECGGNLKYEQAVSHLFSTSAIYKCEKCEKVYEIKL